MIRKRVTTARANDDFTLDLEFGDGVIRRFDAKPYLDKGIFVDLKDLAYFKKVNVAHGTVHWENEQDFAPETLYLESEIIG
jgi:hypothetical protein